MKRSLFSLLAAALFLLTSCDSDDYSSVLVGDISGVVTVQDQYGEHVSAQGVEVTVEGFNRKATTQADGYFSLKDVPHLEKINLIFNRSDLKTNYLRDINHFQENTEVIKNLSIAPVNYVQSANVYLHNTNELRAQITLNEAFSVSKSYNIGIFLGKKHTVSDTEYSIKSINGGTSDGNKTILLMPGISVETLRNQYGFKRGETAYLIFYTGAANLNGYWLNDQHFWGPGLNTNNSFSCTLVIP